MYHLELRKFPQNVWRFNLSEQELRAIAVPWARGDWFEVDDRKWSPHQAKLTVLEGPRIPVEQLSMGRGWRTAQRQGEDVTERVLEAVRAADGAREARAGAGGTAAPGDARSVRDALDENLRSLLGQDAPALLEAWRQLATGDPGRRPSESLAAAEAVVRAADASAN
jgi:hypothetical protein